MKILIYLLVCLTAISCASPINIAIGDVNTLKNHLTPSNIDLAVNSNDDTMLTLAAWNRKKENVEILLKNGANPNKVSKNGMTPLFAAMLKNNYEITKILLDYGADPNIETVTASGAIHFANQNKSNDLIDLLISKNAKLNMLNKFGYSPLILYIATNDKEKRSKEVAKKLIDAGADVDLLDSQYKSALSHAIILRQNDVADKILDKSKNLNAKDHFGNTSLIYATIQRDIELINRMIKEGANVNISDGRGMTPIMIAASKGDSDTVNILMTSGADLNLLSGDGSTVLSYIARFVFLDVIKNIIKNGGNPSLGKPGKTPLDVAKQYGHKDVVVFLENALGIKSSNDNDTTKIPIATIPKQNVVKEATLKELKISSTGSGFRVSPGGEIVTNAHVVEGCQEIRIGTTSTPLIVVDSVNDLAVIKGMPGAAVSIRDSSGVKVGENSVVVGFPLSGLLGTGIQANTGDISSLLGIYNDSRFFQISAPVNPGNSGGPLFDSRGNLIGIIRSKLSASRVFKETGDIPQNINFAIKSNVLAAFLNSHNISHKSIQLNKVMSVVDIVENARETTVAIQCWK